MQLSKFNSQLTEDILRFESEGKFLERKGRDTKASHLANELIGMLNAGGGVIVYGIADDGVIEDLQHSSLSSEIPHNLDPFRKIVHDFIKPPARIELEEIYLSSGALVFLYHVESDYERVFQRADNETVYLRVADSNKGPLKREQVAMLEYNQGTRMFEEELRPDFNSEDLQPALCEAYRKAMNYGGDFTELAYKRNLCAKSEGAFVFKNAAILLFSQDPERYIPNASVRYVRYQGIERKSGNQFNVIKDHRFEGSVPALIDKLETFVEASLRDYYYLDIGKGKFLRVPEFPKDAWFEGIVNALCHRSYNIQGNPIMIRHFDDRLEIINSGPLPAQVTVENIKDERFSRNPRLARTLSELAYVRELNEGVPRIYQAMSELMLASPEYTDNGTTVTLTLRNQVTDHKATILADVIEMIETHWQEFNKTQCKVIQHLFQKQEATVADLSEAAGVGGHAIRYNLKKLITQNILERQSEQTRDPNALYRFRSG